MVSSLKVRLNPSITLALLVAAICAWLACSMIVLRSPMVSMLVYHAVLCLAGGLILLRSAPSTEWRQTSSESIMKPALITLGISALVTTALWLSTFLFRPGLIDPRTISDGLESIGMSRDRFWFSAAYLIVVNPFAEEFFWRRAVLSVLMPRMNPRNAVALSSALFAAYHPIIVGMIFPALWLPAVFVAAYIGGFLFAYLYSLRRSLVFPVALHIVVNLNLMLIGYLYSPSSTP